MLDRSTVTLFMTAVHTGQILAGEIWPIYGHLKTCMIPAHSPVPGEAIFTVSKETYHQRGILF